MKIDDVAAQIANSVTAYIDDPKRREAVDWRPGLSYVVRSSLRDIWPEHIQEPVEWPWQSDAGYFYGTPDGEDGGAEFERTQLVMLKTPFVLTMGHLHITRVRIHRKCANSLTRVFERVKQRSAELKPDDLEYGGTYNFRPMRGSHRLSMHAHGCAIDIAPSRNPYHSKEFSFTPSHPWVEEFEREGWIWGGRWNNPDAMHFQAARV